MIVLLDLSLTTFANPSALHLLRRQTTLNDCIAGPCSWIGAGALCQTVACECVDLAAAGPAEVASCITCVQPFNATLASGLSVLATECASLSTLTATPTATMVPQNATTTGPTMAPTCEAACSLAIGAERTCLNYNCACPTVLLAGSICSQCYQPINATQASLWGDDIAICRSWSATAMPNTTVPAICTQACNNVASVTTCANLDCSCPVILSAGRACSQCLGSFNLTESTLGPSITSCLKWGPSGQATPTPTITASTVQVTVASSQTPSVGNKSIPFEWTNLMTILGIVAGLLSFLM